MGRPGIEYAQFRPTTRFISASRRLRQICLGQQWFQIAEHKSFELRGDAFNVFNHTQFSGYNTTVNFSGLTNPTVTNLFLKPDGTINNLNGFGTVSGARDPRIMQLAMRFVF